MNRAHIAIPISLITLACLAGCPNGATTENPSPSQQQQQQRQQQSTTQPQPSPTTTPGHSTANTAQSPSPRDAATSASATLMLEWAEFTTSPADAQADNPTTEQIDITLRRLASEPDGFVILTNTANNLFIQATMVDQHFHVEFHNNTSDIRARTTATLAGAIEAFLAFAAGEYGYFSAEAWIPIAIDGSDK